MNALYRLPSASTFASLDHVISGLPEVILSPPAV
jgi:hypothetical protein